ncbi:uncharacterized protein F4807DRAFT_458173 [Annulohypoxylon truncatum]|uniref:uncharacterized protein n=1 Tax=Annulohypoxylon truncatum TaxID=327061 RepID=UPI00200781F7|nr:uncharacterized protein F4807DRAFT_458173 [Annulohypoxylon truncatum]KAI1211967.1 hypothetical protein F4807DRAFT_458173 [Annulohypoxylon truncatum]
MSTPDDAGFHRFEWVKAHMPDSDKLARSSAPYYNNQDSDQKLTDASINFLKESKITHVISLNSQANNKDITDRLINNGIAYTPLPVEDYQTPTLDDLSTGNKEYRKHRSTLVWCGYGYGRTGTMVTGLQIYAEKDKAQPQHISHDEYKANHVETEGQTKVLDELQAQTS